MKAVVVAFNQEKALVKGLLRDYEPSDGTFSSTTNYCPQLAHVTVLTGYRMLPRKDLVRAKQYFIIDAACAAVAYSLHQVSKIELNGSLL